MVKDGLIGCDEIAIQPKDMNARLRWHGICYVARMISWRGQSLEHLSRPDLEAAASEAITRVIEMGEAKTHRDRGDAILLAALAGAGLTLAAITTGLMLP
jgi:hypothetical protein